MDVEDYVKLVEAKPRIYKEDFNFLSQQKKLLGSRSFLKVLEDLNFSEGVQGANLDGVEIFNYYDKGLIEYMGFVNCNFTRLDFLEQHLSFIHSLEFSQCDLPNSISFSDLIALTYMKFDDCTFNLDFLNSCLCLSDLALYDCREIELDSQLALNSLKALSLCHCGLIDLELFGIKNLENLELLSLEGTEIESFHLVAHLLNLENLVIRKTNISGLEPIKHLMVDHVNSIGEIIRLKTSRDS